MDNCKYVVIDTEEAGPAPILFPPFISHADFAARYFGDRWWDENKECRKKLLAAGFVAKGGGGWNCIGGSDTLKLKARPQDTNLLRRMLPED
jgi:hypothetical protein